MKTPRPYFVPVSVAAQMLRLSPSRVRQLIASGKLAAWHDPLDRQIMVPSQAINAEIERRKTSPYHQSPGRLARAAKYLVPE